MGMHSISIIGIGRMGGALAIALSQRGCRIENLVHRSSGNAAAVARLISPAPRQVPSTETVELVSDIVLITSADTEIEDIAAALTNSVLAGSVILHTSGSLSSSVLKPLRASGASLGSMHPLVSISDSVTGSERFAGAYFCIEGDDAAVAAARSIAESLGGIPFSIDTAFKSLYHASAVMASGNVVALIDAAIEMLSRCGIDKSRAQAVLLPLIRSTIGNLEAQTPSDALTGTFARADADAFERHFAAMDGRVSPEIREIYLLLGERSLALAEQQGADREAVEDLRWRISMAKRILEC